jgi:hypothetical protein
MTSKQFFKRLIPAVIGGAAMLVLAMPMTAMARDWHHERHHDNGRHLGWSHRDRDDDDHCDFRGGRQAYSQPNYYPRNYYQPQPAYPYMQQPYGFGYGQQMSKLQRKWAKTKAAHQAAVASGNRRRAKVTADHLYTLDREMGARPNYNGAYNNYYPYNSYNAPYAQTGPVLGQLGNMFGLW